MEKLKKVKEAIPTIITEEFNGREWSLTIEDEFNKRVFNSDEFPFTMEQIIGRKPDETFGDDSPNWLRWTNY